MSTKKRLWSVASRSVVVVAVGVLLLAASAQAAIPNSFGLTINHPNVANLNLGLGSGAETLSTNWQNSAVQGGATWTDGVLSVQITNQNALSGASSFWNGGNAGAGTDIGKASGKVHYYAQNERITGLDTLGWTAVDIYLYGHNGYAEIISTNPGLGYGGTVVTNGAQQTMSYNSALTTYVNGAGGTGNYLKFSNISPLSSLWVSMQESDWSAIQIVRAEIPCITVVGDPGTPADWATGTTWDINPATPDATHTAYVRHTVSLAAASGPQTVAAMFLDNANSDLRIESGASLSATNATVSNGALLATGALNATNLNVSGGATTIAGGSPSTIGTINATAGTTAIGGGSVTTLNSSATGTAVSGGSVTTANITAGTANLSGGTIGTVTTSGGTTTLGTSVTALNANSGSAILTGPGAAVGTAVLKTGSTVDTQGNYLAVNTKVTLNDGMEISASGAAADVKGASGDNIGDSSKISHLRLNGGTTSIYKPGAGPETVLASEGFETDGTGTRYNSNTNLTDPAGAANTAAANSWGRVTSVPTHAFYGNGSNPTEGSVMWMGEETQPLTGNRSGDTLERTASWLDLNALSVAGKTGLRLTVDLMADGLANGSRGPETNDEFKIRVKNVDTGVSSDVEYLEGQANNPYKSKINGTQLNTPGVAVSMSYDVSALLGSASSMQLTFAHSQNGGNGVEYLAFDNIKVYGRDITADPIILSSTTVELNAAFSTLNIGAASSASFFDLVLATGVTTDSTLRVAGTNWTAVSGLASFFDVTADNKDKVSITASNEAEGWINLLVAATLTVAPHPGDANSDGTVNFLDYNIVKTNYLSNGVGWAGGDLNDDGVVNFLDYNIVKTHYLHTNAANGTGVQAVPEPASLFCLFGVVVPMLLKRRAKA